MPGLLELIFTVLLAAALIGLFTWNENRIRRNRDGKK